MDGEGQYIWADGCMYIGNYISDKKQGFGKFIWPNGKRYEGEWLNGK